MEMKANIEYAHLTFSSCHYGCVQFPATAYYYFFFKFFSCKAVLVPAALQFLHLPCFLCSPSILFDFLLTLSTFVSTTTSLIIFATSSLSSLPFKSLFTSTTAGKNAAIEPVFCSVGRLSLVSREISTPRAPQAD